MHEIGEHSISDLAEILSVSWATGYRTLQRGQRVYCRFYAQLKKPLTCHFELSRNRPRHALREFRAVKPHEFVNVSSLHEHPLHAANRQQ